MAYSDFTNLLDVTTRFELTLIQQPIVLVEQAKERKPSELLSQILQKNMKSNVQFKSEKAKGELVISPILVEVTDLYENTSLFSGETFDVDRSRGFNGVCVN